MIVMMAAARVNVQGVLLQAWCGIGIGEGRVEQLRRAMSPSQKEKIRTTNTLVIHLVNMCSADLFEKINQICQYLRRSSKPFGGIRLIMIGDPLSVCIRMPTLVVVIFFLS